MLRRAIAEFVVLLATFFVSAMLLLGAIDIFGGDMSDEIGGTVAMIAALPAIWLACLVGRRTFRDLVGHPPYGIWRALAVTVPVGALSVAAAMYFRDWHWQGASIFHLAMIPIMAWVEELLFRGWFPQFLGGKLYSYLLPIPIFAAIHAPSSALGWIAYLVSGTCFALVAWRTRGIGMSTVLHAVSNYTIYIVMMGTEPGDWLLIAKILVFAAVTALLLVTAPRRLVDAP